MKLKDEETSLWCSEVRIVITLGVLVGKGQEGVSECCEGSAPLLHAGYMGMFLLQMSLSPTHP